MTVDFAAWESFSSFAEAFESGRVYNTPIMQFYHWNFQKYSVKILNAIYTRLTFQPAAHPTSKADTNWIPAGRAGSMLSLTMGVWGFQNDALWDTH